MGIALPSSHCVFEVQQLRNGEWRCFATHLNQQDAVGEAKRLVEQNRYVQTRVVQEGFYHPTDRYLREVVFRSQPPTGDDESEQSPQEAAVARYAARGKKRREKEERLRAERALQRQEAWHGRMFYAKLLLLLFLICVGAAMALEYLRQYG